MYEALLEIDIVAPIHEGTEQTNFAPHVIFFIDWVGFICQNLYVHREGQAENA